jgi:membrane-bound lytic murein transglycosylase A
MGETTGAAGKAQSIPLEFSDLAGWQDDDHAAAFAAFRLSATVSADHPPKQRALGIDAGALAAALAHAEALPETLSGRDARAFFEASFRPLEVVPPEGQGFFTGYYEPEVAGSLTRTAEFTVPLLARPDDLVAFDPANPPPGLDPALRFARKTVDGHSEYADRAAIMAGALDGRGLELVWLADPVDAFFIHIQGAARIRLADGRTMRVTYAAKTGHPYTPIGRVLLERGALEPGTATMPAIRAWLAEHSQEAAAVMAANRSYIFFREAAVDDQALGPIAAAKVPLTPGRSLAVDRLMHSFHLPVWIETTLPDRTSFSRLMIAQDTGSAIVGPARGDIFFGSGEAAGAIAGAMSARGRFIVLEPTGAEP